MIASLRTLPGGSRVLAAVVVIFALAGCESDQPYKKAEAARHHAKPPPPLGGKENFFDGRITAEIQTGNGFGDAGKDDASSGSGGSHGGGGMHMGGGGRHGGGGGGRRGGGSSDNQPSIADSIEQDQVNNMRRAAANGGPPVIIHLRFTNNGTNHVDLWVPDFLSELGNFVIDPEKVSLDPGQSVEVEPMTSRLVGEISQADITLTVRVDGKNEKKTITLIPLPAPPPAPGAPVAPATPEPPKT